MNDRQRAIKVTIQIKESFFSQFEHLFVWTKYMSLRSPLDFASAKLIGGKTDLKVGMLQWTKKPIPTSLLQLDPVPSKLATKMFKNILGFMGDKPYSYPDTLAEELVTICVEHPDISDEIYCQVLKQLTNNPSRESGLKGWELVKILLKKVRPTDDFANYLEIYIRKNAPPGSQRDYVLALHELLYGATSNTPAPRNVPAAASPASTRLAPPQTVQPERLDAVPSPPALHRPPIVEVKVAEAIPPPPPPPPPIEEEPQGDVLIVALFDYESTDDRFLSMRAGDQLRLVKEDPSGWWQAEYDGVFGYVPSNYVSKV